MSRAQSDPALKIEGLSKMLGSFSLKDISLEITAGEYFVLLGPTGAGKTTLLEVLLGFQSQDSGRIFLNSQDMAAVPPERRGIAYIPQNCLLFPHMTVFENVEFGLKMQGMPVSERRRTVNKTLEIFSMSRFAESLPATLSGGERRKVVLARALAIKPKVALLDEPLASIDPQTSRILKNELRRINKEFGVTFLHVTHDQMEAFSLADRIAIIKDGRVVRCGVPSDIFSNPEDEFTARFLGYENICVAEPVRSSSGRSVVNVQGILVKLESKIERDSMVIALRPEDITIATEMPIVSMEEWNILKGKVLESVNLGPLVEVTIDAGMNLKAFVNRGSFLEMQLSNGKDVYASFKASSVKVLNPTEELDCSSNGQQNAR